MDLGNGGFVACRYEWDGTGDINVRHVQPGLQVQVRTCGGTLLPMAPTVPVPLIPSNAYMTAMGTAGFSKTIPTRPLQSAAVFLGELRQLPGVSLTVLNALQEKAWKFNKNFLNWKRSAQKAGKYSKHAASDYLNLQFGWLPFLRDIDNLLTPRVEIMKHVNQLERDSGKRVRRRRQLTAQSSATTLPSVAGGYGYPLGLSRSQLAVSQGTKLQTNILREKAWFSACYSYYLQSKTAGMGIPRAVQMARLIHGMSITPDVLWNLAPWSWLMDYNNNVGKVISNLAAFSSDNLVAHYAYVMVETRVTTDIGLVGIGIRGGGSVSCFMSMTAVCKRRTKGTPYGFGFSGPLTAKQASILVALGISRL